MTYQRNMGLKVEENVANEAGEGLVGHIEVGADNGDGDDHDSGGREELAPAGPLDFLELAPALLDERTDTAPALALGARLALGLLDRLDLPPAVTGARRGGGLLEVCRALGTPRAGCPSHRG